MRPSLRLGHVKGIEIGVHWSLLVVGALLVSSLASGILPDIEPDAGGSYWAAAILAVALFFGSILAHELAHSLVALRRGQRVEGITLWLFGGVARLKDEARDAKSELMVAIAGPLTSFALGAAFVGAAFALDTVVDDGSLLPTIAVWLGVVNIVLAIFNLLPGSPLDGGRVLTALIWMRRKDRRRAQIISARVGRVLGYLLIGVGVYMFTLDRDYGSLWTALIGWFVVEASRAEEQQARLAQNIDGRTVADVMSNAPPHVPEWTPAGRLPELTGMVAPNHLVLTDFGGAPTGLVERALLRNISADTPLRERAIPLARLTLAPRTTPLRDALTRGLPAVVIEDGKVVGVVGFEEVERATPARAR